MSSNTTRMFCRWCGVERGVKHLKRHHGKARPRCVSQRSLTWLQDNDYRGVGRSHAVLDGAGVVKYLPVLSWVMVPNPDFDESQALNQSTGEIEQRYFDDELEKWFYYWVKEELVSFEPFVPRWAYEFARRLMEDQVLIEKLGDYTWEDRTGLAWMRKVQAQGIDLMFRRKDKPKAPPQRARAPGFDKVHVVRVLPIATRIRLVRTMAASSLAREMFLDDPYAAALIAKAGAT